MPIRTVPLTALLAVETTRTFRPVGSGRLREEVGNGTPKRSLLVLWAVSVAFAAGIGCGDPLGGTWDLQWHYGGSFESGGYGPCGFEGSDGMTIDWGQKTHFERDDAPDYDTWLVEVGECEFVQASIFDEGEVFLQFSRSEVCPDNGFNDGCCEGFFLITALSPLPAEDAGGAYRGSGYLDGDGCRQSVLIEMVRLD